MKSFINYCIPLLLLTVPSCKKYLDAKQNQSLVVPTKVQDLQILLDNYNVVNYTDPISADQSADDYFMDYSDWASRKVYAQRIYTWAPDDLFRPDNNDWTNRYNIVYLANTALDNLGNIQRVVGDEADWNNTKGIALFLRGKAFAQVAWIWSLAYDSTTSSSDLGIPLRLNSNFNEPSVRSTVGATYQQIVADLIASTTLLPDMPVHVMRPAKAAAYGWMARVYLSMRKYDSALQYANKCLGLQNQLMDYNSLDLSKDPVFESFNPEVIYQSVLLENVYPPIAKVDSTLYAAYDSNDLRKTVMFYPVGQNEHAFWGSYDGSNWDGSWFGGIATDEMYLTRAECYARTGNVPAALTDLNKLLVNRWKTGTFTPITALSQADAVQKILLERRKELYFRGLRWMDIKRLNKEGAGIILKRVLNGQTFTLPPNDLRYALAIPDDIISLSGMKQNPR